MLLRIGALGGGKGGGRGMASGASGAARARLLSPFISCSPPQPPPLHFSYPPPPFPRADDILTGHRNQQHDPAGREDKRPAEEQDEDKAGGAIGED